MKHDHPAVLESARFVASEYTKQIEAEAVSNLTTIISAYATPGKAMVEQASVIQVRLSLRVKPDSRAFVFLLLAR